MAGNQNNTCTFWSLSYQCPYIRKTMWSEQMTHIIGFPLSIMFLFSLIDSKLLPSTSIQVVQCVKVPLSRMPTSIFRKWEMNSCLKMCGRDGCRFGVRDERVEGNLPWRQFTIMLYPTPPACLQCAILSVTVKVLYKLLHIFSLRNHEIIMFTVLTVVTVHKLYLNLKKRKTQQKSWDWYPLASEEKKI